MQTILLLVLAGVVIWIAGCILLFIVGAIVQCILGIFRAIKFVITGIWNFSTSSSGIRFIIVVICLASIRNRGFRQSIPLLAIGTIIVLLIFLITAKKKYQYLSWLKEQGVGKLSEAPVKSKACKKYQDRVYSLGDGYVMYAPFYDNITKEIAAQRIVRSEEIESICVRTSPLLVGNKLAILMEYWEKQKLLLEITSPNAEGCYLTRTTISDCTTLFEEEGGATVPEFAEICQNSKAVGNLELNYQRLAETILNNIVGQKKAKTVKLPEGTLFIANDLSSSKMKQVEITL